MKVLVSTPCHNGMLNCHMVHSLIRVIENLKKDNHSVNWHTPISSALAYNRNLACQIALDEEYDYLLFWDGDISVDSGDFVKYMINTAYRDEAMVVGLPVALKGKPTVYNWAQKKSSGYVNGTIAFNAPFQVDVIGTGIMLIARKALEIVNPPWFHFEDTYGDKPGFFPEDWGFCEKVTAKGGKIMANPSFSTSHHGSFAFE